MKIKFVRLVTADVRLANGDLSDVTYDRGSLVEAQVHPSGEKWSDLELPNGDFVMDVPTTAFTQYN